MTISTRRCKTKFKKGNPGKPKGAISKKTKLWHLLGDYICEEGAMKFQKELIKLSGKDFIAEYLKALEFFKPKQARVVNDVNVNKGSILVIRPGGTDGKTEEKEGNPATDSDSRPAEDNTDTTC